MAMAMPSGSLGVAVLAPSMSQMSGEEPAPEDPEEVSGHGGIGMELPRAQDSVGFDPYPDIWRDGTSDALDVVYTDTQYQARLDVNPFSSFDEATMVPFSAQPQQQQQQYLTCIRSWTPVLQHCTSLIRDSLCAIPEQMLRKDTFPPFIHPHWQQASLPESLAVCMHVSNMFATRTEEVRPFIWRTILAEHRRAIKQLPYLTVQDLLSALQAGMVYLMMAVVDGAAVSPAWVREMVVAQYMMCDRFLDLSNGEFCQHEDTNPSLTWEDWVFAESRRRTTCTWFLIARTFLVKTKDGCPTTEDPRTIPLPSSRLQWEARSQEAWLQELDLGSPAMRKYGHLIDAKRGFGELSGAAGLNHWNARTDSLGSLLNIAAAVV